MGLIGVVNFRNLDLNLLAVFDAIFAEGNLTRASRRLAMSQPAVSNALSRLRVALNDPLFTRTAQGMTPTAKARLMAAPVRQALDLIQNAVRGNTEFDYRLSDRKFTVAVEDYGEAVIMPRFMDWLSQAAPRLKLDIQPLGGNLLNEALKQGEVDLAITYFRIKDREFQNQLLMEEALVSMVRQDHPSVGDVLTLEQYVDLPHVILAPRTAEGPVIDRALKKMGLTRRIALQVPHFLSMPLIVKGTDFVCTLPRRMAAVYAENFRLKILKTPVECPAIPIFLVWHQALEADPGHAWLRESLADLSRRV
ncbi:MAG: LysR family transcriptional regulator [Pseudomonadota bacterium]